MATTQSPRGTRRNSSSPVSDPAQRGLLLLAVAVLLGIILLWKGGAVGFDTDRSGIDIGAGGGADKATTTTAAPTTTATPSTVPAGQVVVVSANGTSTNGLAGKAGTLLAQQGYTKLTTTEAVSPAASTTVYWAQGFEGNAKAIATILGLAPTQVQQLPVGQQLAKKQATDSSVVLVLGPDVQAKLTGAAAGGATTTTAAGGATAGSGAVTTTSSVTTTTAG